MPFLLGIIAFATAAYFFVLRARRGAEIATELMDAAQDVKAAARRFGFSRKQNVHPVDSIEDPKLAIGTLAAAFIELDDLPTSDTRNALYVQLRKHLQLGEEGAQEIAVLGRWFVESCGGAQAAVTRTSRRLYKLDGGATFDLLMSTIQGTMTMTASDLSDRQRGALEDIKRAFRLK